MNAAAAHTVRSANLTVAAAKRTGFAAGDLVLVLPGYDLDTRAQTRMDTWADTHMHVIKVLPSGDCLLGYDEKNEEVALAPSRLIRFD